jgi:hypothetical protein
MQSFRARSAISPKLIELQIAKEISVEVFHVSPVRRRKRSRTGQTGGEELAL